MADVLGQQVFRPQRQHRQGNTRLQMVQQLVQRAIPSGAHDDPQTTLGLQPFGSLPQPLQLLVNLYPQPGRDQHLLQPPDPPPPAPRTAARQRVHANQHMVRPRQKILGCTHCAYYATFGLQGHVAQDHHGTNRTDDQ